MQVGGYFRTGLEHFVHCDPVLPCHPIFERFCMKCGWPDDRRISAGSKVMGVHCEEVFRAIWGISLAR